MSKKLKVCIDPGHGMSNVKNLQYDTGAVSNGVTEAGIVMDYTNELRKVLYDRGWQKHEVIRTRVDDKDPAPVSRRDDIARAYSCDIMLSFHCNSYNGKASGTEVIYRGEDDKEFAAKLSNDISKYLEIPNRGAKTEKSTQHKSLAIMEFDKCWLIELGFIDNSKDRSLLLNPVVRKKIANIIADNIEWYQCNK